MSEAGGNRVLVVGGTRGAGCLIARLLHERGYDVRVLARDPARASAELGSAFEVVAGDLTKADTLPPVLRDVDHIIFTAGAPSGRYAPENIVKTTDYDGVIDTLAAARKRRVPGSLRLSELDRYQDALIGGFPDQPAQAEYAGLASTRRRQDPQSADWTTRLSASDSSSTGRAASAQSMSARAPCPGVSQPHCPRRRCRSVR